ncbi:chorismate synthase [Clostridium novyi A str. 4552]|uniref:Chorismate synthase n=1 Tax=Clostridium novyi A str. 4552 TaxID=1444289 RepID=A0A0A0IBY9_CLONO|nr:chorismate synthase [Clostridium novyi]KGM98432.1 chorismate synthase [Clostridium novyi A str. 4552]
MSGVWGNKIKYSIFGESHGKAIGITIDGLQSGIEIDLDEVNKEMRRRAPGRNKLSTARAEKDEFEILSGIFNGKTTGTPICAIIRNSDKHSKDYEKTKNLMRPGHADYTGFVKYDGFNDYRGGGHFSGRLTAPIVFAGAIAKQLLAKNNILVGSHIKSIGNIEEEYFNPIDIKEDTLKALKNKEFATIDDSKGKLMQEKILKAKENMNSVGGIVECAILNLPSGIGSPFFGSVESVLSSLLFSVPAVKGVEFGAGFKISEMKGNEANDEFYMDGENIKTYTNNNGGILGGITTGMPVIFRVAFKPTPSIAKEQRTINIETRENTTIKIEGRHDPCIVQRAIPVVESVAAMGILELI